MFKWPPPRRRTSIAVVIPSSNLSLYRDLRLKTRVIGEIARALSVFRVSALGVFRDPDSASGDHRLLLKISKYMLVPPYLRVKTYSLDRDLRFVGLLPPLAIYPHNPENRPIAAGDIRFGLIVSELGLVDVGFEKLCRLVEARHVRPGKIVLVRVNSVDPLICSEILDSHIYTGYNVVNIPNWKKLRRFLKTHDFVINTSKKGRPLNHILEREDFLQKLRNTRSICLLFGNPEKDFDELIEVDLKIDITVNFIPHQGTLTVRTYEALISTLTILNTLLE
ncbi:MAG: putative RNA uridine N3 methyltransferase [Sulfolobales archaeon]|nr:hypothetical protein [Sulfolobales archaeon]MDW8083211.1 putative RNA uridine N3 methyltransferase [Sulfolobales archaeon]